MICSEIIQKTRIHAATLLVALMAIPSTSGAVLHHFLTWERDDTARTLSLHMITDQPAPGGANLFYDWETRGGNPANYRFHAKGRQFQIAGIDNLYIQKIELFNLTPGRQFFFVAGSPQNGFTPENSFHTLPLQPEAIRFVTGGDMGVSERSRALCREAARQSPDFVLIGGDLAYGNGKLTSWDLWQEYLSILQDELLRPDGSMIPIIWVIGNHEVNNDAGSRNLFTQSPFFMNILAPKDGPTYFTRKFGNLLTLFGLDSGHLAPHDGRQSKWLEYHLGLARETPFTMACYHIPLYPSHREYEGESSAAGRKAWLPLFDQFHLTAALENHDHTLKRTLPLRNNKPATNGLGTLYIGDGCFGQDPRTVDADRWYLAHTAPTPHFWVVEVHPTQATFTAIDENGNIVDNTSQKPRT